ncbi:MAG: tetratricopeptide repeat protein [Parvularculales bacterium]
MAKIAGWGGRLCLLVFALLVGYSLVLSSDNFVDNPFGRSTSVYGQYLAARHAGANQDFSTATDYYGEILKQDSEKEALLKEIMRFTLSNGNVEESISFARRVHAVDSKDALSLIILSAEQIKEGYPARALTYFDTVEGQPTQFLAHLGSAWALWDKGAVDEALTHLEKPQSASLYSSLQRFHRALMLDLSGRSDVADKVFSSLVQQADNLSPRVVQAYGIFLEREGRTEEARALYEKFLKTYPNYIPVIVALAQVDESSPSHLVRNGREGYAEILYGWGNLLILNQDLNGALLNFRLALYMRTTMTIAVVKMGEVYENLERWPEAITVLDGIEPDNDFYYSAQIQSGNSLNEEGNIEGAVARLKNLQNLFPDRRETYRVLGDIYREHNRYDEAEEQYSQSLAIGGVAEPSDWPLYYARAIAYERTGQWMKAEQDLKQALVLSDRHPLILNYLGYSWIDQGMHLEEGLDMLKEALERWPYDGFITDSVGWAWYRLGDYNQAVEYLERAVALEPGDPVINDHLGDALWRVGRHIEARYQWRHALNSEPEEDRVKPIKKKIIMGLVGVDIDEEAKAAFYDVQ